MVTKILPNAVASGGPLQPEPSTRIFASPPVPKSSFILKFLRKPLWLSTLARGATPARAPWKSRGREADEARSSVPQRQLRSERVAMRGDGGASAASGGRSDGRSTAGKRDRRRSRCVVGRAVAKGAAPRERAAFSVLSRGIGAIGVG